MPTEMNIYYLKNLKIPRKKPWILKDAPSFKRQFNSLTTLSWSSRAWRFTKTSLQREIHETAFMWHCFRTINSGMLTVKFLNSWSNTSTFCISQHLKNLSSWASRNTLGRKNKMMMMLTFKLNGAFKISLHWDWHDSAFLTRSKSNSVSGSWIWSSDIYSTNIITIIINLEIEKKLCKFCRKKKFKSPLTSACGEYQCLPQRFVSLICISLHCLSRSTGQ